AAGRLRRRSEAGGAEHRVAQVEARGRVAMVDAAVRAEDADDVDVGVQAVHADGQEAGEVQAGKLDLEAGQAAERVRRPRVQGQAGDVGLALRDLRGDQGARGQPAEVRGRDRVQRAADDLLDHADAGAHLDQAPVADDLVVDDQVVRGVRGRNGQ